MIVLSNEHISRSSSITSTPLERIQEWQKNRVRFAVGFGGAVLSGCHIYLFGEAAFLLWIVVMDARLGQAFEEQMNSLKRFTDSKFIWSKKSQEPYYALSSPSSVMNHTHHHLDSMASRLSSQGLLMTVYAEIESVAANKNNNEWIMKELKMLNDESPCAGKTRGMMYSSSVCHTHLRAQQNVGGLSEHGSTPASNVHQSVHSFISGDSHTTDVVVNNVGNAVTSPLGSRTPNTVATGIANNAPNDGLVQKKVKQTKASLRKVLFEKETTGDESQSTKKMKHGN
nr:hypothetical protein [Tanacetum cinerariifolium]